MQQRQSTTQLLHSPDRDLPASRASSSATRPKTSSSSSSSTSKSFSACIQLTPVLPSQHADIPSRKREHREGRTSLQVPCAGRKSTSVNFTLHQPATQRSAQQGQVCFTYTYSTSHYNQQLGMESRLEIVVQPQQDGTSNVASVTARRQRPLSCHNIPTAEAAGAGAGVFSASSLQDLRHLGSALLVRQRRKLERMKSELRVEKEKLLKVQEEVRKLERTETKNADDDGGAEDVDSILERQLNREIQHLRKQCEQLNQTDFYQYPSRVQTTVVTQVLPSTMAGGWTCPKCTFHNHPLLNKCEQCDMPNIVHVLTSPAEHIRIHITPAPVSTSTAMSARNAATKQSS